MKIAVFSTKTYDRESLLNANKKFGHSFEFFEAQLHENTMVLASGCETVCAFVNDRLDAKVLTFLSENRIRLIALRCAGFNNVDLEKACELGLTVVRVPAYSPYAVAEHTMGLILALNRKIYRAFNRVRDGNFSLEGLQGFDLYGKTIGVIGTGRIGICFAKIALGFGCKTLAYDRFPNDECRAMGVEYVPLETLFESSDIVSLHCPLMPETHHLINEQTIKRMKQGVMIINTSRGALIDTRAAIRGLKSGKIGYLGLDVYEEEGDMFFKDLSGTVLQDDLFARLLTFPNVLVTGHQAFFTSNALENIADTTLENVSEFEKTGTCSNTIPLSVVKKAS